MTVLWTKILTFLWLIANRKRLKTGLSWSASVFQKTNTLIILDDCAASKDVKGRTSQLVSLDFSARHAGISVWVLTQQITSIAKPFWKNVAHLFSFTLHRVRPQRLSLKSTLANFLTKRTKSSLCNLKGTNFQSSCLITGILMELKLIIYSHG